MKKFQKTLILAFEIIVKSPKRTFEIVPFFRILEQCECALCTALFDKIAKKVNFDI